METIRRWVEQAEEPFRIVARKVRGTQVAPTHPLCAYPLTARKRRFGSTDDAAAFTCRWRRTFFAAGGVCYGLNRLQCAMSVN